MKKMCIECPIYRGRHMYYCMFEKQEKADVKRKNASWDKEVLEELSELGRMCSVLKDLEDARNL